MSSLSDLEEDRPDQIPFILDDKEHLGYRKAALFESLEDFLDEYDAISLLFAGLPLIILAELWRDKPFNTLSEALNIKAIGSCLQYGIVTFANVVPLLLFVAGTIPESFSEPSKANAYHGPSIVDILPQEVIETIIDYLALVHGRQRQLCNTKADKFYRGQFCRAFSSYSLVCRAFTRRSQHHIFSTLVVRSSSMMDIHEMDIFETDQVRGARLRSMVRFVGDYPHLAKNIKHLKIAPSPRAYGDSSCDEHVQIQTLLSALNGKDVKVGSLCLGFQYWALRPSDNLAALFLPSSLLASVTSLHIDEVFGFPPSFLLMFLSLHSLSLSNFRVSNTRTYQGVGSRSSCPTPKLRSLVLKQSSLELLHIMGMARDDVGIYSPSTTASLDLSQLTHCDLVWMEDEDQNAASSTLIKTYGSAITHFTYEFRCFPEYPDEDFVNLEHLPALQELTVVFEPRWGVWGVSLMRQAQRASRPGRDVRTSAPSTDFLLWFLSKLCADAPLKVLTITCPHIMTRSYDPTKLFLNLGWNHVDTEIRRIYDNIAAYNPSRSAKFMVNLTFRIPVIYPGGMSYENGEEINREGRLQWVATTKRKWHRVMRSRLRKQFPLIEGCPGISLNIFYALDSVEY